MTTLITISMTQTRDFFRFCTISARTNSTTSILSALCISRGIQIRIVHIVIMDKSDDISESVRKNVIFSTNSELDEFKEPVRGYDWNHGLDFGACLDSFQTTGFQATNFALSVQRIREMIECRNRILDPDNFAADEDRRNNCTIFLGYTSNMVSCGVRESIRFLAEHNYVRFLNET